MAINEIMKNEQFLEKVAAVDEVEYIVGMNLQKKQAFLEGDLCVCERVW